MRRMNYNVANSIRNQLGIQTETYVHMTSEIIDVEQSKYRHSHELCTNIPLVHVIHIFLSL